MTDRDRYPSRPPSVAAAASYTQPLHSISPPPRPSVSGRTSRSSLRRQAAAAALAEAPHPQQASIPSVSTPRPRAADLATMFHPFFTLLTTSTHPSGRRATQHPAVHYVFEDDDLEALSASLAAHHDAGEALLDGPEPAGSMLGAGARSSAAQPSYERGVMLDMLATDEGTLEVNWASSLSPDWAVLDTSVGRLDSDASAAAAIGDRGLVLRIEGLAIDPVSSSLAVPSYASGGRKSASPDAELHSSGGSGRAGSGGGAGKNNSANVGSDEYGALVDNFDKRMTLLRRVVQAGEDRRQKITAEAALAEEQGKANNDRGSEGAGPFETTAVADEGAASLEPPPAGLLGSGSRRASGD